MVRAYLVDGDRAGAKRAWAEARDQLLRHLEAEPGPELELLGRQL